MSEPHGEHVTPDARVPPDPAHAHRSGDWDDLRHTLRHRATEAIDLISILVQDAVILLAGFLAELAYEKWLHSEHPFFRIAITLSSSLFLLLYVITVTVHVVTYVRGSFGTSSATRLGRALPWAVAAVAVIGAVVVAALPSVGASERSAHASADGTGPLVRFEVTPPGTLNENPNDDAGFALSPDGQRLATVATTDHVARLWVRSLDRPGFEMLAGTEGAHSPWWSPDSRSVAFIASGRLKRIDIAGGPPRVLCDMATLAHGFGGAWSRTQIILFLSGRLGPLGRVSADGGECSSALPLMDKEAGARQPQFVDEGRHLLFREMRGAFGNAPGDMFVGSLDGEAPRRLLSIGTGDSNARVAGSYLLLLRQGSLVVYPFDPARAVVTGDPAPVKGLGEIDASLGRPSFSASETGVLAFRAKSSSARGSELQWVDRSGHVVEIVGASGLGNLGEIQLSPDGRQLTADRDGSIWLVDVRRGMGTRFTGGAKGVADESAQFAVWSRDGRRVAFRSVRNGRGNLFERAVDGSAAERTLLDSPDTKTPLDWSPEGVLAYQVVNDATGFDVWGLPLEGVGKPFPTVNGKGNEGGAQFSPDGHWIAYQSDESGIQEIYVQPFPGPGRRWQASSAGGTRPRWRTDGRELFYLSPDIRMMAVPFVPTRGEQGPEPGTPVPLFQTQVAYTNSLGMEKPNYAVSPDGQRFLINTVTGDMKPAPINIVINWPVLLKGSDTARTTTTPAH